MTLKRVKCKCPKCGKMHYKRLHIDDDDPIDKGYLVRKFCLDCIQTHDYKFTYHMSMTLYKY